MLALIDLNITVDLPCREEESFDNQPLCLAEVVDILI
jgi:hypothetical protein